jgi:hypothetical protein
MMPFISQVSRQQFVQQSFPACMRSQVISPRLMPRVVVRDQRWLLDIERPNSKKIIDGIVAELKAKKVNPIPLYVARTMPSTSTILPPSNIIYFSEAELSEFEISKLFEGCRLQFPVGGVYGNDRYEEGRLKTQIRKLGDGPFSHVAKGLYDVRGMKYLWVFYPVASTKLDSEPVEAKAPKFSSEIVLSIIRELIPFPSNRGVPGHPNIAPLGYFGGEVWFLPRKEGIKNNKYDEVHINLNSGRFPTKDDKNLYIAAKYWLSLGYHKVFITPRDQRYGKVTPILFMKEPKAEAQSDAKPKAKSLEFV